LKACVCAILAAAVAVIAVCRAAAQDIPHYPGIREIDQRVIVDPLVPPWNAITKIQTNIGSRCTGVLVAPAIVLTAAHCLYNRLTHALLQPVSLHVLVGYERGAFRWHRLVANYTVGDGFDGNKPSPQTADWARIELAEAIPDVVAPLPMALQPAASGMAIALVGYSQDRAQLLRVDPRCHVGILTPRPGGTLLLHDCSATRGTSGGPLLTREGNGWAVVGINIGAGELANVALAAPRVN
jgi:protease YdgD